MIRLRLLRQNRIDGNAGEIVTVSPERAAFLLGLNLAEPVKAGAQAEPEKKTDRKKTGKKTEKK